MKKRKYRESIINFSFLGKSKNIDSKTNEDINKKVDTILQQNNKN